MRALRARDRKSGEKTAFFGGVAQRDRENCCKYRARGSRERPVVVPIGPARGRLRAPGDPDLPPTSWRSEPMAKKAAAKAAPSGGGATSKSRSATKAEIYS